MFTSGTGPTPEVPQTPLVTLVGERMPLTWRERVTVLEAKRVAAGLSVGELAAKMGVKRATIDQYVYRRRGARMGMDFCERWLSACGCELRVVSRG